jgi:protease-4
MPMKSARWVSCVLFVCVLASCAPSGGFKITPIPADQTLQEEIVDRAPGWVSDRIALIDISGILINAHEPGLFASGEHPVSLTVEKLKAVERDRRVKAVVLRINSPGGTVTASDTLHEEIAAFKKRTGKPVVAFFQDVAASGAYYLSCASDEIVAQRTSVTGSIGVVMQMVDLSGTMTKLGIKADAIKSGPYKDAGSPLRTMDPKERAVFQALVDGFYKQFLEVVVAGRPKLGREAVLKLADGRVYTAAQALEAGLIDRVGTLWDAIAVARERAGIKTAHTVLYHRPMAWKPNVYAQAPGPPGGPLIVNLFTVNCDSFLKRTPTICYIWQPDG